VISSSQRTLADNTKHSQEIDIHSSGGIRTRNPSKRAAAGLRTRPQSHWDRQFRQLVVQNMSDPPALWGCDCAFSQIQVLLCSGELKVTETLEKV